MTSRHSSAASCCDSDVEPTRSQKRTVRWRRSPAVAGPDAADASSGRSAWGGAAVSPSDAPHLPQKSEAGEFSAPHLAQGFASAFPHFAQKLLVAGLLAPHFVQRIDTLPAYQATDRLCITQPRLQTSRPWKSR